MCANNIEEIRFPTWDSFKSTYLDVLRETNSHSPYSYNFIYRGQRTSSRGLKSSFDRLYEGKTLRDREGSFLSSLKIFKQEASKHGFLSIDDNENVIAAKAQHYGFPTRLLDWSYSPYVAAYFAFNKLISDNESQHNTDVAIWSIDKEGIMRELHESQLEIIEVIDCNNDRLVSQSGVFTRLLTKHTSINEMIEDDCNSASRYVKKFIIPAFETNNALYDLALMGINAKSLFPGLQGIAEYSRMKYMLNECEHV